MAVALLAGDSLIYLLAGDSLIYWLADMIHET
jgi:hypothetical protein